MGNRDSIEQAVKACYATWSESYYSDYCSGGASYPPVHYALLQKLCAEAGASTLLDAGCGPASFLRGLAGSGMELYGFDLTPEMVSEGKRVFAGLGLDSARLWEGSVLDAGAYTPPVASASVAAGFDGVVCSGVLPHIAPEADAVVLENLCRAVRPGGLVAVEARNALFALFTLNRYSMDFFRESLIRVDALEQKLLPSQRAQLREALQELEHRFKMDLPPVRTGDAANPGYDEVLSRTHNPFELAALCRRTGLHDVRVLFYHYHCLPPMLAQFLGEPFLAESIAMEDPEDWRGHFMASAFIVTGVRA